MLLSFFTRPMRDFDTETVHIDVFLESIGLKIQIQIQIIIQSRSRSTTRTLIVIFIIFNLIFFTGTGLWSLHLCLGLCRFHDEDHANLLNSMWFIAITFLSVGFGDIVPNTYCGRGIAVTTGIMVRPIIQKQPNQYPRSGIDFSDRETYTFIIL